MPRIFCRLSLPIVCWLLRHNQTIDLKIDGDFVDVDYHFADVPFQRIRRITGYLVGTLDRFNDAKRAEVRDRVKHGLASPSVSEQ